MGLSVEGSAADIQDEDHEVDPEYKNAFKRKFTMLKAFLMKFVVEKVPVLKLTKETAKRVLLYCQDSYFKHMRLYEFIFNNTSPNEMKRINFVMETVKTAKPLSKALMISEGRPVMNMGDTGTSNMMMSEGDGTTSIQNEMEDEDEDMAEPPIDAMD